MKYSLWVLRLGLATVFFWFGIDKFLHGSSWLIGVFEVLIGLSLVTGIFMSVFAVVGIVLLALQFTVRDAGLIGGLLALILWQERKV